MLLTTKELFWKEIDKIDKGTVHHYLLCRQPNDDRKSIPTLYITDNGVSEFFLPVINDKYFRDSTRYLNFNQIANVIKNGLRSHRAELESWFDAFTYENNKQSLTEAASAEFIAAIDKACPCLLISLLNTSIYIYSFQMNNEVNELVDNKGIQSFNNWNMLAGRMTGRYGISDSSYVKAMCGVNSDAPFNRLLLNNDTRAAKEHALTAHMHTCKYPTHMNRALLMALPLNDRDTFKKLADEYVVRRFLNSLPVSILSTGNGPSNSLSKSARIYLNDAISKWLNRQPAFTNIPSIGLTSSVIRMLQRVLHDTYEMNRDRLFEIANEMAGFSKVVTDKLANLAPTYFTDEECRGTANIPVTNVLYFLSNYKTSVSSTNRNETYDNRLSEFKKTLGQHIGTDYVNEWTFDVHNTNDSNADNTSKYRRSCKFAKIRFDKFLSLDKKFSVDYTLSMNQNYSYLRFPSIETAGLFLNAFSEKTGADNIDQVKCLLQSAYSVKQSIYFSGSNKIHTNTAAASIFSNKKSRGVACIVSRDYMGSVILYKYNDTSDYAIQLRFKTDSIDTYAKAKGFLHFGEMMQSICNLRHFTLFDTNAIRQTKTVSKQLEINNTVIDRTYEGYPTTDAIINMVREAALENKPIRLVKMLPNKSKPEEVFILGGEHINIYRNTDPEYKKPTIVPSFDTSCNILTSDVIIEHYDQGLHNIIRSTIAYPTDDGFIKNRDALHYEVSPDATVAYYHNDIAVADGENTTRKKISNQVNIEGAITTTPMAFKPTVGIVKASTLYLPDRYNPGTLSDKDEIEHDLVIAQRTKSPDRTLVMEIWIDNINILGRAWNQISPIENIETKFEQEYNWYANKVNELDWLWDYQKQDVTANLLKRNNILGSHMGTGKTRQMIATAVAADCNHALFVTKKGFIQQFIEEFTTVGLPAPKVISSIDDIQTLDKMNITSYEDLAKCGIDTSELYNKFFVRNNMESIGKYYKALELINNTSGAKKEKAIADLEGIYAEASKQYNADFVDQMIVDFYHMINKCKKFTLAKALKHRVGILLVDEAHLVTNIKTSKAETITNIHAKRKIFASGTPITRGYEDVTNAYNYMIRKSYYPIEDGMLMTSTGYLTIMSANVHLTVSNKASQQYQKHCFYIGNHINDQPINKILLTTLGPRIYNESSDVYTGGADGGYIFQSYFDYNRGIIPTITNLLMGNRIPQLIHDIGNNFFSQKHSNPFNIEPYHHTMANKHSHIDFKNGTPMLLALQAIYSHSSRLISKITVRRVSQQDGVKDKVPSTYKMRNIWITPDNVQVDEYKAVLNEFYALRKAIEEDPSRQIELKNILGKLRHLSFNSAAELNNKKIAILQKTKLHTDAGDKIIMFVETNESGKALAALLESNGYNVVSTISKDPLMRGTLVSRFKHNDQHQILILNTKSGSHAYDIPQANVVMFVELPWFYYVKDQAFHRVLRPGQLKDVVIYTFINKAMIDEYIHNVVENRKIISSNILDRQNKTTVETSTYLEISERLYATKHVEIECIKQLHASDVIDNRKNKIILETETIMDSNIKTISADMTGDSGARRVVLNEDII